MCFFQSSTSISAMPPISNSSSLSSKTFTRSGGMSSLNPVTKALNCSSTLFWILHSVMRLSKVSNLSDSIRKTKFYSMYSFLLSFVTSIFRPFGLRSTVTVSPKISSSVENVFSKTPVISLSLKNKSVHKHRRMASTHTRSNLNSDGSRRPPLPCLLMLLSFAKSFCRKLR